MGKVTRWDDPSIKVLNPGLLTRLEGKPINVVYRADKSGTTEIHDSGRSGPAIGEGGSAAGSGAASAAAGAASSTGAAA